MDGLDQQQITDGSPKLEQYLLDSIAAVTSSSTSVTSTMFQTFVANGGSNVGTQSTNEPEMPQLMSILNELLDGQDLTSLANTGGNGDNMQDMVDQEENYEEESPRKDDPEEFAYLLAQQRLEELSREEQQLQRKMDFLTRRLYKLVARSTGLHVSEEVSGFLEYVARYNKQKEKEKLAPQPNNLNPKFICDLASLQSTSVMVTAKPPVNLLASTSQADTRQLTLSNSTNIIETPPGLVKPVPINDMKSFLRRIETLSTIQSTILNKRAHAIKYFTKPAPSNSITMTKSEMALNNNTIPRFENADLEQIDHVSGLLMSEMRLIEKQIDSDATASSSGGESADEMVAFNNHYQDSLSM